MCWCEKGRSLPRILWWRWRACCSRNGERLWFSRLLGLTLCPAFCGFPFPIVSMTNCKPLFSLKINMLMGLGEAL